MAISLELQYLAEYSVLPYYKFASEMRVIHNLLQQSPFSDLVKESLSRFKFLEVTFRQAIKTFQDVRRTQSTRMEGLAHFKDQCILHKLKIRYNRLEAEKNLAAKELRSLHKSEDTLGFDTPGYREVRQELFVLSHESARLKTVRELRESRDIFYKTLVLTNDAHPLQWYTELPLSMIPSHWNWERTQMQVLFLEFGQNEWSQDQKLRRHKFMHRWRWSVDHLMMGQRNLFMELLTLKYIRSYRAKHFPKSIPRSAIVYARRSYLRSMRVRPAHYPASGKYRTIYLG
jgi:hypothetical protein